MQQFLKKNQYIPVKNSVSLQYSEKERLKYQLRKFTYLVFKIAYLVVIEKYGDVDVFLY